MEFELMSKWDIYDSKYSKWHIVTIVDSNSDCGRICIHFDGYSSRRDRWIHTNSDRFKIETLNTITPFHDYLLSNAQPCTNRICKKCMKCNNLCCCKCYMLNGKCKNCNGRYESKLLFEALYSSLHNLSYLNFSVDISILASILIDYTSTVQIAQCHNIYCNNEMIFNSALHFKLYKNVYHYEVKKENDISNTRILFEKRRRIFCGKCISTKCNFKCDNYKKYKLKQCIIKKCNNWDIKCICNNHLFPICVCCKEKIINKPYICKRKNCGEKCHYKCVYAHEYYHCQDFGSIKYKLSNQKQNKKTHMKNRKKIIAKHRIFKRRKNRRFITNNDTKHKCITVQRRKRYKKRKSKKIDISIDYRQLCVNSNDLEVEYDTESDSEVELSHEKYMEIKNVSVSKYHKKKYFKSKHIKKRNKARKFKLKNMEKRKTRKHGRFNIKSKHNVEKIFMNDYFEYIKADYDFYTQINSLYNEYYSEDDSCLSLTPSSSLLYSKHICSDDGDLVEDLYSSSEYCCENECIDPSSYSGDCDQLQESMEESNWIMDKMYYNIDKVYNSTKYYRGRSSKYNKSKKAKQIGNCWKQKQDKISNIKSKNKCQNKYRKNMFENIYVFISK